jgi:hypothetical protein
MNLVPESHLPLALKRLLPLFSRPVGILTH